MGYSSAMSSIIDLARFVARADMAARPESERHLQRRHIADAIVAAVAGRHTAEGQALAGLPPGDLADAAGRAAALIRHTEIDDIHLPSCTTPSSVAVGTALVLARGGWRPELVANGIWAGTEVMARFGAACDGPQILYRGVWPTLFTAPMAAAATASRLWELDVERTAAALSIALLETTGRLTRLRGRRPARWVLFGHAVAVGVRAALAAREGFEGDADLLDGPWLRDAHNLTLDRAVLTGGVGERSVYDELSLKPFCAAKQTMAAIDGLLAILNEGVAAHEITRVRVRVPPLYQAMIAQKPDGSRLSTIAGVAVQLGLVALRRERLYDICRDGIADDGEVMRFAEKVEVAADPGLLAAYPTAWPAEIEVEVRGTTFRRRVTAAPGDPQRRLDDVQLADKARHVLRPLVGVDAAQHCFAVARDALDDDTTWRRAADAVVGSPQGR